MFQGQNKLANAFRFKDRIPKELTSGVVYILQCGLYNKAYYGECVRQCKNWRAYCYIIIDYEES